MWFIKRRQKAPSSLSSSALRTLPGCVCQGEAASLQVDAAVHHQLPEEQRGVSGRPTWGIPGRALWSSSWGARPRPGHELNDGQPGHLEFLRPLLIFSLLVLRALGAQVTHGAEWIFSLLTLVPGTFFMICFSLRFLKCTSQDLFVT